MTSSTLSLQEAAAVFGISRRYAYQLARDTGRLVDGVSVFRVGSLWKVSRAAVDAFLAAQAGASSDPGQIESSVHSDPFTPGSDRAPERRAS